MITNNNTFTSGMLAGRVILYVRDTVTTHPPFKPAAPRLLPNATKTTFIIDWTSCEVKLEKMYVFSPVFPLLLNFNENSMSRLDAAHAWKVN